MSTHETVFTRAIAYAATLLLFLVVPLISQAQTMRFPVDGTGTLLKSMTLKLWVTQNGVVLRAPVIVTAGNDFTIQWEAVGKNVSNEPTTAGITCQNNWNTKTAASGSDTGFLLAKRTFLVTCAGLGTGRIAAATVTVASPDLAVGRFSLTELTRATGMTTVAFLTGSANKGLWRISVWNLGPATVVKPFNVSVDFSTDKTFQSMNTYHVTGSPFVVNGIGRALSATSPFIKPLAEFRASILVPGVFFFRVCVDPENVIRESNENNNCVIKPATTGLQFI